MKIALITFKTAKHQCNTVNAIAAGIKKLDSSIRITRLYGTSELRNCGISKFDVAAVWGTRAWKKIEHYVKNTIIMERAYYEDRKKFISLGFNGLNNRADFLNKNMPSDRFEKHFKDHLKPWRTGGEYILVTPQIKGDMSLAYYTPNYQKIIDDIKKITDIPIYVKDHPVRPYTWGKFRNCKYIDPNVSINEALKKAKVCVTVNSNSGVDAMLMGVPVFNFDAGSMVWDLAMKGDLKQINDPIKPDRTQWAYNLAYTQWLPSEIESGEAWSHLRKKFDLQ